MLFFSFEINAQVNSDYYTNLEEAKWFPRQSVRCIFQDSKGYMWIGTNAGLFRYNTFELKNYDMSKYTQTKFLNNSVNFISEDKKGNIIVATESGLGLINTTDDSRKVLTENDETVTQIAVSKNGTIWYYNSHQEIFKINPDGKSKVVTPYLSLIKIPDLKSIIINQLYLSPGGDLYIACNMGLYKIDQQKPVITSCKTNQNIKSVFEGDFGQLIIVKNEGVFSTKLSKNNKSLDADISLLNSSKIKLLTGETQKLLVVASTNNIYALENKDESKILQSIVSEFIKLNNININVLFVDRALNIWLGTQKGLYKINRQSIGVKFYDEFLSQNLENNIVNDVICDEKSKIWIATSKSGLYTLDLKTNLVSKFLSPYTNVNLIRKAYDGNFIIYADSKMVEIDESGLPGFKEFTSSPSLNDITDMVEISPGEWWITSWRVGLIKFLMQGLEKENDPFFNEIKRKIGKSHLFGIIKDSHNQVWMITRGDGVFRVDLNKKAIFHYNESGKLKIPSNRLICIIEDAKGHIWIGTRGSGLLRYLPSSDSFKVYDMKDGLPANTISDIQESASGDIWVSTLNGVARFQPDQLLPFYSYGIEDGIFNPEFTFAVGTSAKNDELFFGNANGLYKINFLPKTETLKTIPIVWTSFRVLNNRNEVDNASVSYLSKIQKNESITLAYKERNFRIGFAALDYGNPDKVRYAYRLKDEEKDWNFISGIQSDIQYLDMKPGEYDFQVRVSNERGEWSNFPEELHITILPSFWLTNFAFAIYAIILIIIFSSAFYLWRRWYKLNKDLKTELEVSELHNQQMVQYADLSHEIKNRLTLILGPLEQALHGKKVNQVVLNNLYEQANRLKKLSDQIINIRKNESGGYVLNVSNENISNHLRQIYHEMEPLAVVKNVSLTFNDTLTENCGWYDRELVEIIVLNILGNSIKYSIVNGNVAFDLKLEDDLEQENKKWLLINIKDNGIGIPKEDISKILDPFFRASNARTNKNEFSGDGIGLNLVYRLIKIHHGTFTIESEPSVYTIVKIKIPINKEEYNVNELKINVKNTQILIPDTDNDVSAIITSNEMLPEYAWYKGNKNILIVDDEKQIRKMLNDTFKSEFNIYEAKNGLEAIEVLNMQAIDLVLSDLSMPVMDGLSLCSRIRKEKKLAHLPFIIMTARNSDEQKLVAFKSQIDDFVEKPFSLELVKWRVKAMLRQQSIIAQNLQKVVVPDREIDYSDSIDEIFIQKVVNLIDKEIANEFLTVDYLADEMNMSRATFYRRMEQLFGESPSNYIKKARLKKATLLIKSGKYSIAEIAFKTGFKTSNYFSKCFQKEFGASPTEYIK